MTIRIGRYSFGLAAASMIAVFVALSVCAVVAALHQARPEYPMQWSGLVLINEGMALLATLLYGMVVHFLIAIVDKFRK